MSQPEQPSQPGAQEQLPGAIHTSVSRPYLLGIYPTDGPLHFPFNFHCLNRFVVLSLVDITTSSTISTLYLYA